MARTPCIPPELTRGPFTLEEARAAGLTLSALTSKAWRRLGAELYCLADLREDPWRLLLAWQHSLPAEAVFTGATAAWLFGLDLDPTEPVETVVPPDSGIRSRVGLTVRRCELGPTEVSTIRGMRTTALPLTLAGLCMQRPAVEALVAIDMAVCAGLTDADALGSYAEAAKGRPGAGKLRSLARLAAPAESPMETRLRWLLIQAGLPRPQVQMNLHDAKGQFIGRADLYYHAAKLILEYDGGNHRERLVEDDRRQNLLVNAGFRLLRFTATDVHNRPAVVEAQVRGALSASGSFPGARTASYPRSRTHRASAPALRRW
jgi:very-short-patch-repair endonuclease